MHIVIFFYLNGLLGPSLTVIVETLTTYRSCPTDECGSESLALADLIRLNGTRLKQFDVHKLFSHNDQAKRLSLFNTVP